VTLNGRFTVRLYRLFARGVSRHWTVHFSADISLWLDLAGPRPLHFVPKPLDPTFAPTPIGKRLPQMQVAGAADTPVRLRQPPPGPTLVTT